MNQKNYEFLVDTLERHGMGHPAIFKALKTKMELNQDEFELGGIKLTFDKDQMWYNPKFGKGEGRDGEEGFYYLNKISATLVKENGEKLNSEFSLYKQRGFNVNEMHKLLIGRPVYKRPKGEDGRWTKIDFTSSDDGTDLRVRSYYDNTTNFSLSRELGKLPIKWANPQEKEDDIRALQSGERVSAVMRQDGKTEQVVIGVSPQIGGLTLFNSKMEVIKQTQSRVIEISGEMEIDTGQKQNGKLSETTKKLMDKINNPAETKETVSKKRKVS